MTEIPTYANPDEISGEFDDFGDLDTSTLSLWEGDEGQLDLGQRRALVVLLKQRFISAQTHPKEWKALIGDPRPIRARLHDLFLDLLLDTDREVAYKRQVTPEGAGRFPTLLYDTSWSREETILLVYLRSRLRTEQAAGIDHVFVDRDDMLAAVAEYQADHDTDLAAYTKRSNNAIRSIYKAGLLIGTAEGDRFEVSTAIEVLLPLERLLDLLAWLREQNSDGQATTGLDDLAPDTTPDTAADTNPVDRAEAVDGDLDKHDGA